MRGAGAVGWRGSLIVPVRRCGRLLRTTRAETSSKIAGQKRPGEFRVLKPKASARRFHQSNGFPARRCPPGAPERLTGSASQEGIRRLLRSQPPSPRLWATSPGATPAKLCEHTMRVTDWPPKIGTFYLAGNRNFLFGS